MLIRWHFRSAPHERKRHPPLYPILAFPRQGFLGTTPVCYGKPYQHSQPGQRQDARCNGVGVEKVENGHPNFLSRFNDFPRNSSDSRQRRGISKTGTLVLCTSPAGRCQELYSWEDVIPANLCSFLRAPCAARARALGSLWGWAKSACFSLRA